MSSYAEEIAALDLHVSTPRISRHKLGSESSQRLDQPPSHDSEPYSPDTVDISNGDRLHPQAHWKPFSQRSRFGEVLDRHLTRGCSDVRIAVPGKAPQ